MALPVFCAGSSAPSNLVLPAGIADEVAEQAAEQERLESFVLQRIAAGAPLPGTYPPDAEILAAYTAWCTRPV